MTSLEDLPLRPRKFAQTKLALLNAAMARLDDAPLEAVQVKDLCEDADISQASFFNYFPQKTDLLVYFVQLWTLDMAWHVQALGGGASAKDRIQCIFAATARQAAEHPGVMAEVLAGQARLTKPPVVEELTVAERLLAFPGREGLEALPSRGLDSLLPELLADAVARGELPPRTDVTQAFLGLSALFFGVPLALLRRAPAAVGPAYERQLDIYWAGLTANVSPRSRRSSQVPQARRSRS